MTTLTPAQVIELMNMKGLTGDERELLWDLLEEWEQGYEPLPEDQKK